MSTQLIVALDVPDLKQAESIVKELSGVVRYFKVGMQLFTACGPDVIKMIKKYKADVFLDLKFHDIPNTVAQAALSSLKLGVFMFNVHALGGDVMLAMLMQKVNEHVQNSKINKPVVLGVTILTSMDRQQLNRIGVNKSVKNQVVALAKSCKRAGLNGVVCSGKEIKLLKRVIGKDFVLVVPGIRPADAGADDQKRIVTPAQAAAWGADYIVVGRPITQAQNRKQAALKVLEDLK